MAPLTTATHLSLSEGVLLAHAMVSRLADGLGVRVFFIKGPASVQMGLRKPKISTDVDVFVAPAELETLRQGLRARGWRERPVDPDGRTFPKHSVTVDHADWPCCIDVHSRFPGMEKPAAECFETMWGLTEELVLAGQVLRVPTKPLGILVLALHALRSPHLPACRRELDHLASLTERDGLAAAVLKAASATGSLAAVRPFLEDLLPNSAMPDWPQPSLEWRNRLMAREPGSARLLALAQAPWWEKPEMLWRAVFPANETFLGGNIYADLSVRGRLLLHRARWSRFLRAIPRIAQDFRSGG